MRATSWIICVLTTTPAVLAAQGHVSVVAGHLAAGQEFTHPLGNGLLFCLEPDPDPTAGHASGWYIQVGPTCGGNADNYAAVATPPLHGPNPIRIDAWQFKPDATAPQGPRKFAFVLTKHDYDRIMAELNANTDSGTLIADMDQLGRGRGTLEMTHLKGHQMLQGEWVFDWIEFQGRLEAPAR